MMFAKMPSSNPIAPHLSMKAGGSAFRLEILHNKNEVVKFVGLAEKDSLPICIIGGGTNTLFDDGEQGVAVGKIEIKGIDTLDEDAVRVSLHVGAGENWDDLVAYSVRQGWSGIEALSAIPGTVGGGPIQNIGAYGSEIKDTLESVEVFDPKTKEFTNLDNRACKLSYRDSIFKHGRRDNIIVSIVLRLHKTSPIIPHYPDVEKYFQVKQIVEPNLEQIREAIISIRSRKLPDPKIVPNCGSFFKNPIVSSEVVRNLKTHHPNLVTFETESGVKLSAGWLVQECGFKGKDFGAVQVYPENALVLTAKSGATTKKILEAAEAITSAVKGKFGITLEREPVLLPLR